MTLGEALQVMKTRGWSLAANRTVLMVGPEVDGLIEVRGKGTCITEAVADALKQEEK